MIRITQTYTIRKIIDKLKSEGFLVIYKDLPHGRRSGIGDHAKINLLFEKMFDRSPDIIAVNNGVLLLIVEVDHSYNKKLNDKFRQYDNKSEELLTKLSTILDLKLDHIEYGFGITKTRLSIEPVFKNFHKFYFTADNEIIHEVM